MSMRRITAILALALLSGCIDAPPVGGVNGPTGRASDAGQLYSIPVRAVWKYELRPRSQDLASKKLQYGLTARFGDDVQYEGFYDAKLNVTRVAVYGNVSTTSDYGAVYDNGYYVIWEQDGRVTGDELPPWRLMDVIILDQPY